MQSQQLRFARKWELSESKTRSLVKAITWRITGSLDTFILSWIITGQPIIAMAITAVEFCTKVFLYWLHERIWLKVEWGKDNP